MRIAQAATTRVVRDGQAVAARRRTAQESGFVAQHLTVEAREGEPVTVEKLVALFTSKDRAIAEPGGAARGRVGRLRDGFDELLERHVLAWDQLWRRCRIELGGDGDPEVARTLNLHVFHLLQTVSQHTIDLDAGVPARGLHGEAYRGHIFWDELFIFPFLNLRLPELTRALLRYRARRLPEARLAARAAGFRGAMYPWQSGSDGREETQRLHLNPRSGRWLPDRSRRQRHVNVAVAYNVWQYYQATGDLAFLSAYGAEMLLEIARFWAGIASYNRALDRYEIRGVMGPDEYHDGYPGRDEPGLDNNAYTNVMAAWVLCRALETVELLPDHRRVELAERLGLAREELERWDEVSRKLLVPFHDGDIISQFEGYGELEELDWEGLRRRHGNIRRLDRILEAEGDSPNRYKASKQADVLMLFYLLSAEELRALLGRLGYRLEPAAIRRNVDYYLRADLARLDPVRGGQRLGAGPLRPAALLAVLHRGAALRPPRRPGRHHRRGHPPGRHGRHGRPGPALLHRPGDPRGRALAQPEPARGAGRARLRRPLPRPLGHQPAPHVPTAAGQRGRLRRRTDQGRRQRRDRRDPAGQHPRVPAVAVRAVPRGRQGSRPGSCRDQEPSSPVVARAPLLRPGGRSWPWPSSPAHRRRRPAARLVRPGRDPAARRPRPGSPAAPG